MRLKSVFISQYKNLRNFDLAFDGSSFIDVFVGKNGSGKSNLFEALIEIFRHLDESRSSLASLPFDYRIVYEIKEADVAIIWEKGKLAVNGRARRSTKNVDLPENVLIYYSGHNPTVTELVRRYEAAFSRQIKEAELKDSRRFIGIGSDYKSLLLAVLLLQPETNEARQFICRKLGIQSIGDKARLVFKRPPFASGRLKELGVNNIDLFDPRTHYWGAAGITRQFIEQLAVCIREDFHHADVYDREKDQYRFNIDAEIFIRNFADQDACKQFRQFDNLKTLGMLEEFSLPLRLTGDVPASVEFFSDGQFQLVYIYAIVELFKDRNCITLLDEPDAFLHPEWQFEFLKQVFEITEEAGNNNHVLLSSHSAVTLIPHEKRTIKFFDIKDNAANCYDLPKWVAIKKLSENQIKYCEHEKLLSIIHTIQTLNKPVLFTEGSTDPKILTIGWKRLFDEDMPFIPFYAFSCGYIKQLLTDNRIHNEMGGLPIFALFDFDEAFNQWNDLNGEEIETAPERGMIKKWREGESYAFMLPVPNNPRIRAQVINPATTATFGGLSRCAIEHLFYGLQVTNGFFADEPSPGGGSNIVFHGDKTAFATDIVPTLPDACFQPLRPMFEFVAGKCREFTPVADAPRRRRSH